MISNDRSGIFTTDGDLHHDMRQVTLPLCKNTARKQDLPQLLDY